MIANTKALAAAMVHPGKSGFAPSAMAPTRSFGAALARKPSLGFAPTR